MQSRSQPSTYHLTKGWIEVAGTPFNEYERMVEKADFLPKEGEA